MKTEKKGLERFAWMLVPSLILTFLSLAHFAREGEQVRPVSPETRAIQRVFAKGNAHAARVASAGPGDKILPVDFFASLLSDARARDLSGCPADFREVYGRLLEATEKALTTALKHEEVKTMHQWFGIWKRTARAETKVARDVREVTAEFDRAKQEMLAVALKYDVSDGN